MINNNSRSTGKFFVGCATAGTDIINIIIPHSIILVIIIDMLFVQQDI